MPLIDICSWNVFSIMCYKSSENLKIFIAVSISKFLSQIYYTMSNAQGSEEVMKCSPDETSCVLGDLQAFTTYEIAVALENGFAEGPRSQAQTVTTEEGGKTTILVLL